MTKKLSDDVVKQLRNEYAEARDAMVEGEAIGDIDDLIGRRYGLNRVSVAKITSGQTYKNSPGPRVPRPGRGRATVAEDSTPVRRTRLRVTDTLGNVLHADTYTGLVNITTETTETTEETK